MALEVVYAREEPPASYAKSMFLVGPTPTENGAQSWRTEALRILELLGYDGVVFVPESRPDAAGNTRFEIDYVSQVDWEDRCLHLADVILVWVPRDVATLPGFTTNVEWGVWQDSGKVVFGAPQGAHKTRYLEHYARKLHVPVTETLGATVISALELLGEGEMRTRGEREVPLFVWRTPHFQQWYDALCKAGNTLEHAKVVWTYRVGPHRRFVFFWALHVEIYIAAEGRFKTNEVVLSRPDISTSVLYRRAASGRLEDTQVVLVREFRSTVSNDAGYVYEVAGGSSFKPNGNPFQLAADECREETGLDIAPERFEKYGARQLLATVSAHRAYLFGVELSAEEIAAAQARAGVAHGVLEDSERTFVEVMTVRELLEGTFVDWSMIGMIMTVLMGSNRS